MYIISNMNRVSGQITNLTFVTRILLLIAFRKLFVESVKTALKVFLVVIGIVEVVIVVTAVVSSSGTACFPGSIVAGLLTYTAFSDASSVAYWMCFI